jgi:hypothetical protein
MLQDMLHLRPASMEDVDLLYRWRNDPECRKNSINTSHIAYGDHCRWFGRKLNTGNNSIFICIKESLGRLFRNSNGAKISPTGDGK